MQAQGGRMEAASWQLATAWVQDTTAPVYAGSASSCYSYGYGYGRYSYPYLCGYFCSSGSGYATISGTWVTGSAFAGAYGVAYYCNRGSYQSCNGIDQNTYAYYGCFPVDAGELDE